MAGFAPTGFRLSGRHALVTGGGRGIGRAIAAALAAEGAHVTVLGRDPAILVQAVGEGHAHAALTADVTDAASLEAALGHRQAERPIDILVANAGAAESAPLARSDDALFLRMIEVNLMGVVRCVRALAPGMVERGSGRIVAV